MSLFGGGEDGKLIQEIEICGGSGFNRVKTVYDNRAKTSFTRGGVLSFKTGGKPREG